ncbi:hypothetical protein ACOME3_008714 [Neoechinorhynchus agilis]
MSSLICTSIRRYTAISVRNYARRSPNDGVQNGVFNIKRASLCCGLIVVSSYGFASICQYENRKNYFRTAIKDIYSDPKPRRTMSNEHLMLTPGQRMVLPIFMMNGAVFLAWRMKQLIPLMRRYFLSHTNSTKYFSQLTLPAFSHTSGTHLFVNMFVLWSLADGAHRMWGSEQFYATYLSAASVSILGSQIVKFIRSQKTVSLGASGSIMATIASICCQYPDSRMMIIFLPFFSFSADTALKGILIFDTMGLIFGYLRLDHAAHLAGALFGMWYVKYGHQYLWDRRHRIIKLYSRITKR